jgi:transglutaminase-like putative cysteine protease
MSRIALSLPLLGLLALLPHAARAEFPPITPEEKALTQVAGAPNARAVVLFRKAEFRMMDPASSDISSRLIVRERVKILTEQGKDRGEIQLFHSSFVRLFSLAARTVLPDGRVVELAKDAKFERKLSQSRKYYVTSIAFPNVEVGAILDAEYELRFDNIFYLEPFYFSSDVPVRLAEIRYLIPGSLGVQTWMRDPFRVGVKTEQGRGIGTRTLRAWAENLAPILDEPYGLPFADLATQIMLVPTVFDEGTVHQRLMENWAATSDFLKDNWEKARRRGGEAGKKAQTLALKAGAAPRDRAAAIYSFVRDEIAFDDDETGIFLTGTEPSADAVLRAGHGTAAEKALLLETMLAALKLDARRVWAAPRSSGLIDAQVANPAWFDRVLVAVELGPKDGGRVYLDPTDRRLGFGRLDADYEGTAALLPDPKKPEGVVLAQSPAEQNVEKATVTLQVGDGGRLAGTGKLQLSGLSATDKLRWRETPEKTTEAWHDWLVERFEGYDFTDVAAKESVEERTVELTWTMTQKEEEALGDEATLAASRPLGPQTEPFSASSAQRRSPILFDFPYTEQVDFEVTWPEGWHVESAPRTAKSDSAAGAFGLTIQIDDPGRKATIHRLLAVRQEQFSTREECDLVRDLFAATAKSDAQALVLVHR